MRVWADLTNTAHVVVLRPLIELLERQGHDVEVTARPLSHTVELLEDWGHPFTVLGEYGGATRVGKVRAAASRIPALVRFGRRGGFDYGLGHASIDLPPACRVLRVANTTMFDYEWATTQHHVICRLATRVLVPDAIPAERLRRYGARPPKLIRFPGLKEEYYLANWEPDAGVLEQLGLDRRRPLCVIRTAPNVVVPTRAVDGRSLVALADVLVSAGGTMNREAAVLGTPVWSIFEGKLGAVDEMLVQQGRLKILGDPEQVTVERKPADASARRTRRDLRDLLALAIPDAERP